MLNDDEIESLLSSSVSLLNSVRSAANKPKDVKVDARVFRRWVTIPSSSNELLTKMPRLYAEEIYQRNSNGEHVARTVGVRALLALDSKAVNIESFKELLADFRANPDLGPNEAVPRGSKDAAVDLDDAEVVAAVDSDALGHLIGTLREQSELVASALTAAAEDVRAGRRAPSVQDEVSSWNTLVTTTWETIGAPDVPANASLDAMEAMRERIAQQENIAEAERVAHEEKLSNLAMLRQTADGLRPLIDADETFRAAYHVACGQIATLSNELGLGSEDATRVADVDDPPAGGPENETGGVTDDFLTIARRDDHGTLDSGEEGGVPESGPNDDPAIAVNADYTASTEEASTAKPSVAGEEEPVAAEQMAEPPTTPARPTPKRVAVSAEVEDGLLTSAAAESAHPSAVEAELSDTGFDVVGGKSAAKEPGDRVSRASDFSVDLADHVRAGRFGAAWLVARAAGLNELDTMAYRLAAAAFHSIPGGIDPAEVLISVTAAMSDNGEFSCQSARLALAATLRSALAAGWSPRSELEKIAHQANLGTKWRDLIEAAVAAGDRNYQHLHDFGGRFELSTDEVYENARTLRAELASLPIKFARANKVLKYLLRSDEPVGAAFDAILADTNGNKRREALTEALSKLESPDNLIDTIDALVSSSQQRKYPIESHPRAKLRRVVESTAGCVTEALNAAVVVASDSRTAVAQEAQHSLLAAAKAVDADLNASEPGDVALARLVRWIDSPEPPTRMTNELQVLIEESLPSVSAARDEDGVPIIHADNADAVIKELRSPRPARELFDAYLARGDLQEAAAVARQIPEFQDRLVAERTAWGHRLRREVLAVRSEIARTYADDLTADAHAEAEAQLVTPAEYTGDRFDLQMADLDSLRVALVKHRACTAQLLRRRVTNEVTNTDDRDRIVALIDSEDFVGATELLALARSGPLPPPDSADSPARAQVFDAFTEALSALDKSEITSIHDMVAKFASGELDGVTAHGDLERLRSWDSLVQRRGQGSRSGRQGGLAAILRALGLDIRGQASRQTDPGVRHLELFRVTATPLDGSLVPGLGSQATHYMVATTADRKLLRETLTSGFPSKNGPNIVLFNGVLTMDERRQCLNVCRDQKISAIVVDHAVAAFVAARHPRSFRAVQQITLPFTCFTHYTVVAGNVPDEVFVGRNDELTQLTDRAGSLFVYGGRQLGKSALLRKIQRDFNAVPDQHAIFVDLNSHGIGTWADSQKLWQVLYNELAKIDSMGIKTNMAVRNHDAVIRLVWQWLEGKASRRLLLLLDEADAFLEKESSEAPRGFQSIGPLKGLFDDTAGRFKPVFAGLHKVQRLQNVSNTPLAHGGRDVLIGPLTAKPARDLVVKPLEALGYRFDNPEAVWRLLAFTNLQPGLIQVVCNDLVAHLQSRPLHKGEPLIAISDADIDAVTGDEPTRRKIAEKLRLTIALEDRYRVIALAVAIMCMEDGFREKYTAAAIREHCEIYWQKGFEDLNSTEFEVYLDELIGLGVLIKDHDNLFSVRSPNIVTMLGTKEQLEIELDENEEQFELPNEYNPRSTRRQVSIGNTIIRSPLSEHDLGQLIPVRKKYDPFDFVIVGSDALGITDVARVLNSVGNERGINVTVLDPARDDIASALSTFKWAGGGASAPRILVVDASRADPQRATDTAGAVQSLRKRRHGHLVVAFGAGGIDAANSLLVRHNSGETKPLTLEKWSGDGIRSWHDNPFNTPADRSELLNHSGGWPELVERAVTEVSNRGVSHAEEWQRLSRFPESAEAASTFLRRVGVEDQQVAVLTRWAQLGSTGFESIADVAAVLERDSDDLSAFAAHLARLGVVDEKRGEYKINPVVARAVNTLV